MSISNSSILVDGTVAISAGTATTLKTKGTELNLHNVYVDDGSALIDLTTMKFTVNDPVVQSSAPGGYTQARRKVRVFVPRTLANGNRTVDTFDIQMSTDPETTDAERLSMRVLACNLLFDSEFTEFWDEGSSA